MVFPYILKFILLYFNFSVCLPENSKYLMRLTSVTVLYFYGGGTDLNTSQGSFLNSGLSTVPRRMVNEKKELNSCLKRGRFSPPSSSY